MKFKINNCGLVVSLIIHIFKLYIDYVILGSLSNYEKILLLFKYDTSYIKPLLVFLIATGIILIVFDIVMIATSLTINLIFVYRIIALLQIVIDLVFIYANYLFLKKINIKWNPIGRIVLSGITCLPIIFSYYTKTTL